MDDLRLILLILGVVLVLGIYFWDVIFTKDDRKPNDMLDAVDNFPGLSDTNEVAVPPSLQPEHSHDPSSSFADLGSLLTKTRDHDFDSMFKEDPINFNKEAENDHSNDEEDLPLHLSVREYENSLEEEDIGILKTSVSPEEEGQLKNIESIEDESFTVPDADTADEVTILPYEDEEQDDDVDANAATEEFEIPENNLASDDILVLYVMGTNNRSFNGLLISKAADQVGMIFGHMNIFHHFGPGKLHSGQPLFSMANMYEPGSFDLGRMADLKTRGIALFMYSPASIDASVVFELFLNTTQRIAELLDGEVRTANNEPLSKTSIKSLRDKVESFSPVS